MRKATLLTVMVLLSMTFSMAKQVTLGPDLKYVVEKQSMTRQSQHNVTPWSSTRQVTADSKEVKAIHGEDIDMSISDPSTVDGSAFSSLLEWVNWPTGGFGGFTFEATDSALVWYRPATECTVDALHIVFNSDSDWSGKTANLQLWSIKKDWIGTDDGDGVYDFSELDLVVGDNGPHDQLLAEVAIPVTNTGLNAKYTVNLADWGGVVDVGAHDFALVLGVPADAPTGTLYYSPFWTDRGYYNSFKYYHGAAGWKSRLNFVMMATVDYYGDPPPFISEEVDLDDVYLSDDPGPYEVSANIWDSGTATFPGGLTAVELRYSINGVADTLDLSSQIPSADSIYTASFSGLEVGDFVEYSWYATDNGADDVGGVMHEATSQLPMTFEIREANPNATILIIDDNAANVATDYYAPILEAGGWIYDLWDVNVSGSPTGGILANYSTLIWGQANEGAGILAEGFEDNEAALKAYLDAGGNLFLSSSDYIGDIEGNYDGVWYPPTAGSFLETYLHVAEYVSDANVGTVSEETDDTLYVGVAGSPVSDDYALTEFDVQPGAIGFVNWGDETLPDAVSEAPFMVWSAYLDIDWVEAGVLYDGTYKLIFLPWQFEAIVDDDIRNDLMVKFLGWFGEKAAPLVTYEGGTRYAQAADAGDVMVKASATDGDGTVVSMSVEYTLDDGANWLSVAMTDGVGMIPALTVGDTVAFMVKAVDNDGLMGYSDTYHTWKIDFTPAADILYVGDDYYTWHYGAEYDAANYARTQTIATAGGFTIEFYDVDELYLMDSYSILDQYTAVIWNGYGDWDPAYMPVNSFDNPLTEYVAQGGNLLYSSEEMIGTWFDWPQYQDFEEGQFMYDVLHVNWAANDFGNDSIGPDPAGLYTSALDTFNLESANFYWGNMNDLCDPFTYWGGDASSAPFTSWGPEAWGWNPNSSMTDHTLFLAFSMMMMPDAQYTPFMSAWMGINVAVDEHVSSLPKEFALAKNYPNPFNPSTTIAFDVPTSSEVMITVYDVMGRKVTDLVNSEYSAGSYNVSWNGVDAAGTPVSSGLYIYKMTAGNFTATSKMLFLK
ncbi:MAG: T9SS type A sorting domain-containing protein [Candidatus Marinimicrobia bacterium]|nr:T9SS type A sorting domain-containing protein [Candidatus Neomarinimicrobiota bacterium]